MIDEVYRHTGQKASLITNSLRYRKVPSRFRPAIVQPHRYRFMVATDRILKSAVGRIRPSAPALPMMASSGNGNETFLLALLLADLVRRLLENFCGSRELSIAWRVDDSND